MSWTRFFVTVLASGFAGMFTDWVFMGILFHDKYLLTPELWRKAKGGPETRYIVASTALGVLSCSALILLLGYAGALHSITGALWAAGLAWISGPLPLIATNSIWTRLHPLVAVSHSIGWLVRFMVTAILAAWLIG